MKTDITTAVSPTYQNPVYPRSFPDPFVLKFRGEYYAFCTDFASDGNVFGMLHSRDLVHWNELGGAMPPLESSPPLYWAPEVTYYNGKFYLYYSAGNEILMELRVAVSDRPDGGYADAGVTMTSEEFAIDAHVFTDDDGQRYMFYATDFLTHSHIGTGTVVDRMIDSFTLEGKPRPVTRAKFDWQVYDPQRKEKGGVRWHTVEGPFILKRKGTYFEMFSGGNWKNVTYGVSFAIADKVIQENEWTQYSDGEKVLPILRTIPDRIIGPGHNSVVRGPNNVEEYCIYHRWTDAGRVLCIDRMDFPSRNRIFVLGPTDTPQLAPYIPSVQDCFDRLDERNWQIGTGEWTVDDNRLISQGVGRNEILCNHRSPAFICEFSLTTFGTEESQFGFLLGQQGSERFRFTLDPGMRQAWVEWLELGELQKQILDLPADFEFNSFHHIRIEAAYRIVSLAIDDSAARLQKTIDDEIDEIYIFADGRNAAFSGFSLTSGFIDLFEEGENFLNGWQRASGSGEIQRISENLAITSREDETVLIKAVNAGDFELAVNFAITEAYFDSPTIGFGPCLDALHPCAGWLLSLVGGQWNITSNRNGETDTFRLPTSFSPYDFHQFRFVQSAGITTIYLEGDHIGTVTALPTQDHIALSMKNAAATFDMVRYINF